MIELPHCNRKKNSFPTRLFGKEILLLPDCKPFAVNLAYSFPTERSKDRAIGRNLFTNFEVQRYASQYFGQCISKLEITHTDCRD